MVSTGGAFSLMVVDFSVHSYTPCCTPVVFIFLPLNPEVIFNLDWIPEQSPLSSARCQRRLWERKGRESGKAAALLELLPAHQPANFSAEQICFQQHPTP